MTHQRPFGIFEALPSDSLPRILHELIAQPSLQIHGKTLAPRILWTSFTYDAHLCVTPSIVNNRRASAVVSLPSRFVDRHDYAAAVVNETRKPAPEEAILRAERAKNQRLAFRSNVAAAATFSSDERGLVDSETMV